MNILRKIEIYRLCDKLLCIGILCHSETHGKGKYHCFRYERQLYLGSTQYTM